MADQPPPPPSDGESPQWPLNPAYASGAYGQQPGFAPNTTQRSPEERRAILGQQLQQAAMRQMRVESATEFQAVLVQGKPVNHVLHAILTIFTCLLWGIVWIILAASGGEKRFQLIVDEFGNVHWQNL
jgi:hypothetical protein